ncbi:MAG: transcription elongation factor GreA, partial [Spirochaetota bacterium]
KMSLKMAVNALSILAKDHIWVLKVILKKEELHDKVKNDVPWALKTIIKSFNNNADMKKIKIELVPAVLSAGEWTSWSSEARKILKTDPDFGNLPDKIDHFVVRESPISFEEKTFNKFKAEKNFFLRLQTIQDFLTHSDPDSEYFAEMFDYFTSFVKTFNTVNEYVISSYLVIKQIVAVYPFLNPGITIGFNDLFSQIDDVPALFSRIEDADLKRTFLEQVKANVGDWSRIFITLFPIYLSRYIVDELSGKKYIARLKDLFQNVIENYREYRETFIWIARNINEKNLLDIYDIRYEKILIGMIHLLDITFREINNRKDVSQNRKMNKQIQTFLFKDQKLEEYILKADEESVGRLYTLVEDVKDLDPSVIIELKHKIMGKFPDYKFYGEREKGTMARGLIVTAESYENKQKMLQHLLEVEVPENSKEIGAALQLGDLRENAEYKAAKERQELLNSTVTKLKEEIEKAQIFDRSNLDAVCVSFGTKVRILNKDSGKEEVYQILGPWESEPSKNIISYLSPFGYELLNHKEGEELSFVINQRVYNYKLLEITTADF